MHLGFFWQEKPEGKRPVRRPRCGWEDNVKINSRELGLGGMEWIDLAQDSTIGGIMVNMVMNVRVP
jgi:hypothetical protein